MMKTSVNVYTGEAPRGVEREASAQGASQRGLALENQDHGLSQHRAGRCAPLLFSRFLCTAQIVGGYVQKVVGVRLRRFRLYAGRFLPDVGLYRFRYCHSNRS